MGVCYGVTKHPMMLATNKEIKSKQVFRFEDFRVRNLEIMADWYFGRLYSIFNYILRKLKVFTVPFSFFSLHRL